VTPRWCFFSFSLASVETLAPFALLGVFARRAGADLDPPSDDRAHGSFRRRLAVALTPIFLLSGIATLLNVFATRLARVADLVAQITKSMEQADPDESADLARQLLALRRRSIALDAAIVLGAIAAAATCASVFTLFVGALRNSTVASVLFTTFGLAIVCTISAIMAFTTEMMMAGSGVRAEVARQRSSERV